MLQQGDTTVAATPGLYFSLSCVEPNQGNSTLAVSVAAADGLLIVAMSGAPSDQYPGDKPALDAIRKSFRLTTGGATPDLPRTGAGPQVYRDPRGRFSVSVPQGWTAAPQGDAVQISLGTGYAVLSTGSGIAQPAEVVSYLAGQFQSQYRNFSPVKRSSYKHGTHDAAYGIFYGTNAKGVDVVVTISGISAGGSNYLAMMSSVTQADAQEAGKAFLEISQSIRFAGE
jgi:hypothetical protein